MSYKIVYSKADQIGITLRLAKLGSGVFIIGSIFSMFLYPSYSLSDKYLSDLGTNKKSSLLFNLSVMTTSIILLCVFISLYNYLKVKLLDQNELIMRFGLLTGVISVFFLFFVGYFPAKYPTLEEHNYVTSLFMLFLSISFTSLTWLLLQIQSTNQFKETKSEDYIGFIFVPLIFLLSNLALWYSKLLQKFVVYLSIFYLLYLINRFYDLNRTKRVYYHHEKFTKEEAHSFDQAIILNKIF